MKKTFYYLLIIVIALILVSCNKGRDSNIKGSITLNFKELNITSNSTSSSVLFVTLVDIEGEITWTTSDPNIAIITPDLDTSVAKLKGVSPGTVIIKASIGDIYDECRVTVTLGEFLEVPNLEIRIEEGKTKNINATAHTNDITYTSSDPLIAKTDVNGLITALSEGNVIITIKAGNKTLYVTVIVEKAGFDIDEKGDIVLQLNDNPSKTLTIIPKGGIDTSSLSWSIDDPNIVLVTRNDNTILIEALETGIGHSTTIRFKLEGYPDIVKSITVKDVDLVLSLSPLTGTLLFNENSLKLNVTLSPEQTGDRAKVSWEISPQDIILINDEGLITRNPDYVYDQDEVLVSITAKSLIDPEATKTATIMVENPKKGIKIINDLDSFNRIMTSNNNNATIYLESNIDLEGKVYSQPIMNADFNGHFYGNGYTISNFEGPGLFGSISGTVENLSINGTMAGTQRGFLAFHIVNNAVVKNILIDVTFKNTSAYVAGLALVGNGSISNIIVIANNPNNIAQDQVSVDFVQGGTASNLIAYVKTGNVSAKTSGTIRNENDMKKISTYVNFDNSIWNIVEGEIPNLIIQKMED